MTSATGHGTHDHTYPAVGASEGRARILAVALGANLAIVVTQVVVGLMANSLGLLADAGHNLTDVGGIALSLIAVRLSRRPATPDRSFGFHRSTILAAQGNAAAVLVVSVVLGVEAVGRLLHPEAVHGWPVVIVAAGGAVVNLACAVMIQRGAGVAHGGHGHAHGGQDHDHGDHGPAADGDGELDLNMRGAFVHLLGDGLASLGVVAAGLVIVLTGGWYRLDAVATIAIGVLISVQAIGLLRSANDVLLESTPVGLDTSALAEAIRGIDGVEDLHDLHVWSLSSDVRALSAHVVVNGHPTLEEAQAVGVRVKRAIGPRFGIAHATLELECEACDDVGSGCAIDEATR